MFIHRNNAYDLHFKSNKSDPSTFLTPEKLVHLYRSYINEYSIVTVEDPFEQDDWSSWGKLMSNTDVQVHFNPYYLSHLVHKIILLNTVHA